MSILTQACVATDASENEAEYTYQTCIHGRSFSHGHSLNSFVPSRPAVRMSSFSPPGWKLR